MVCIRYLLLLLKYACLHFVWLIIFSAYAWCNEQERWMVNPCDILNQVVQESWQLGYDVYMSVEMQFIESFDQSLNQTVPHVFYIPFGRACDVADQIMSVQGSYKIGIKKISFYLYDIVDRKNAFCGFNSAQTSYIAQQFMAGIAAQIKSFDMLINPYMIFAAILKSGLRGMRNHIYAEDFLMKNSQEYQLDDGIVTLVWQHNASKEAGTYLLESDFMRDWLGVDVLQAYVDGET